MRSRRLARVVFLAVFAAVTIRSEPLQAGDPEVEELRRQIKILTERVDQLEREKAAPQSQAPAAAPSTATSTASPAPAPAEVVGNTSPVSARRSMNDQQEAAPRPGDLTLDPKYRGFSPVPNTPVMIKFNAKPRTDATYDNHDSGNDDRFVTAQIPVDGDSNEGGNGVFNINARASQLRLDVRAPGVAGSPRFYYENDFFGSGGGEFPYRLRHLYGQIYNVIVGQTYSIFEDPDVWPDTVDYEGPNSAIFARRPLLRYQQPLGDQWQLNLGIEQPQAEVDASIDPDASGKNRAPDGGFNLRWERSEVGHVQFASIFRDIGVRGPIVGEQNVFGWGVNLSSVFNLAERDSVQSQVTYGEGLFRFSNDDFQNNDAAFDSSGDLEALAYLGAMLGYTHHWSEEWRSTLSYGYVHLDNAASQAGDAYHQTHYGSINVMWQLRKRLSVGLEELYGWKETKDGSSGDAFRTQLGLVYAIFD
ncbi:MAG: hypothetical protein HY899_13560 [Deltaproteobacteria bacterium]|nr:hypothetical protein [Deltaproteobacteria bacterium]